MNESIITNSSQETQKLAANLVKKIGDTRFLALYGDLGSGKTTFIQGLAKALNIQKKIISPTFIIMRTYNIPTNNKPLQVNHFYHVDLYRIKQPEELQDLGILDLIKGPQNLFAIEWPEKIQNALPQKRINIHLEYVDDNKRRITLSF